MKNRTEEQDGTDRYYLLFDLAQYVLNRSGQNRMINRSVITI